MVTVRRTTLAEKFGRQTLAREWSPQRYELGILRQRELDSRRRAIENTNSRDSYYTSEHNYGHVSRTARGSRTFIDRFLTIGSYNFQSEAIAIVDPGGKEITYATSDDNIGGYLLRMEGGGEYREAVIWGTREEAQHIEGRAVLVYCEMGSIETTMRHLADVEFAGTSSEKYPNKPLIQLRPKKAKTPELLSVS